MNIAFLTSYNSNLFNNKFEEFHSQNRYSFSLFWNSFGTIEQQILDRSSSFYLFKPDIILLHLEAEWVLGDFYYDILSINEFERKIKLDESKNRLTLLINSVINNLPGAIIVIENFVMRGSSLLGILDQNISFGFDEIICELNLFLFALKRQYPDKLIINNYSGLISAVGRDNCFDDRLFYLAQNPFAKSFYPRLLRHYYSIIDSLLRPGKKCIVVDLDNTLWGGIAGQNQVEEFELGGPGIGGAYVNFQRALLNFYRKGILLAVCSKNNYEDSIEVIEKHPDMVLRKEHFAQIRINWLDKAENIKLIAAELNIGLESIVFLDENPAECEFVKQQLPAVEVIYLTGGPDNFIEQLLSVNSLNTVSLTKEDILRNKSITGNQSRKELELSSVNLDDYHKSLEMQAYIHINEPAHVPRIAQLLQRTNQFNLTQKLFSAEEIKLLISHGNYKIYSLRLIDKFGDNGIVLGAVIRCERYCWHIENIAMSCRTIGRSAETALLNTILKDAENDNIKTVQGLFQKTQKNMPACDFYKKHGFQPTSDICWSISLPAKLNRHFINIVLE